MRWQSAAIVAFVLAAVAYCISLPDRDTLLEQFGSERWTCADMVPGKSVLRSVGWVSGRSALSIMISSRSEISFLGLSCRSRKGLCMPFDGGWQSVILVSQGGAEPNALRFGRDSKGVDRDWFTLARLTGGLGTEVVAKFFADGTRTTIKVVGRNAKLLFVEDVPLQGFHEAMARCGY